MTYLETGLQKERRRNRPWSTPALLGFFKDRKTPSKTNHLAPKQASSRRRKTPFERIMATPRPNAPTQHRTLFLSDIHLGTPGCKADLLLDFLRNNEAETIYLVGDIIDGWRIKRSWFWHESHNAVVQEILHKVRHGTNVIYVPGNHDEALRDYTGLDFAGINIGNEFIHRTADGRDLLVLHGDQFDSVVRYANWLAHLGDRAYGIALALNNWLHNARRLFGMSYWSLSSYLKQKVKNAVEYISSFETAVARAARERGVDGVVCGHIHHAEMREIDGILYCNDGDWVESCTALAEDMTGHLTIVRWHNFSWEDGDATQPSLTSSLAGPESPSEKAA
ncbi:MAG: UDP-2,3-diacylglucosamine diphosphatase [Rhodobiaceae bacterium]|nr:UDP-2,3-diacylglucosamine diphosphatase [Rhodobiaceae bacterium]